MYFLKLIYFRTIFFNTFLKTSFVLLVKSPVHFRKEYLKKSFNILFIFYWILTQKNINSVFLRQFGWKKTKQTKNKKITKQKTQELECLKQQKNFLTYILTSIHTYLHTNMLMYIYKHKNKTKKQQQWLK